MRDSPKISVVLTCYNLGQYLDEAVDSVLAQTFQDFEILIVNDGSTEPATSRKLSDYRRPKTRVVRIANRGLPGARNEGIRQTSGPYICALDADDRLERTYFEKAAAVLDRDPSVAFVSHWLRTFGEEEREWKPESPDFPALLDMNSINGAALVRRDALMAAGLYDETMRHGCEDWDFWIGMVERGFQGVILPEVLFFYRQRQNSMSRAMMEGDIHVGLYRHMIEKHRTSFEEHVAGLIARREADRTTVLAEAYDLELDCETVLRPEIERLRDRLRVSGPKLKRLERQAAMDTPEHLSQSVQPTDAAQLEEELLRYREGAAGLKREIQALRGSWSWRLTRPLRAAYSRLFETRRPDIE